ncbi:ATPase family AAA domain-containing protein [Actinidia chinensis var. chinensis]|uniref:ATPase family AAA domain-containing protein n=1 Tax=Actinidia chinensis var. chinensis TaxID=1590841 RepID=A0A2R6RLE0_ACTCC|nr:ATPase family AAA domain-containing protein [Actinidia chinensis var. chinensis]
MAASRLSSLAAAVAAVAASPTALSNCAHAESPFRFSPFSSSSSPQPPQTDSDGKSYPAADEPRGGGFDAESLERGAKALREINSSPHAKQVFEVMRKQEQTRLTELDAEKAHFEAIQAQAAIDKQQKMAEEQRNLVQQQAQAKAQMLRFEDELTRKRMQTDHEAQRRHNAELVRMQEESSIRKEQARRATEEQIHAQQRQTEKERAEIERETIRVKAMAEAEGRAHEAKLTEDHNRRMLIERVNGEREKWLAAINTTFSHIEGGIRVLLTDRNKLIMTVGGITALAAGVYTTREGARVTWGYINRILGQPSLIRESSIAKFPWSGIVSRGAKKLLSHIPAAGLVSAESKSKFGNVVLHPSLQRRIEHLARATANTKSHEAPFRNMLFYGPPGTGKTMVAREIAKKSGLDYAMMTGGDVAPLGPQAVTKIHEIFDWAKKSKKGLLLFIDEADAFLCERNSMHMSEAQRSALNALLYRTGDQSRDTVLVLATNRPSDLDSAITDRIDEVIEFPLPQEEERFKLLKLYLSKYLSGEDESDSKWGSLFTRRSQKITIKDLSDDVIRAAAQKIEGFSGREIAKLMAGVQAAVYGRPDCVLDSELFKEIVDYKVEEHQQRIKLVSEGSQLA